MDVSIIIVNYNTKQLTSECINSIFEYTEGVTFEVILVDNNSEDGSREYFLEDDRIKFIKSDLNLGFGRANNLGFKFATGKYIFLLNSDTVILNNAIKIFCEYMDACKEDISCLGTILKDRNMKDTHSFGLFPRWYDTFKLKRPIFNEAEHIKYPSFEVDYIIGADLFIRRNVIDEIGFFDPDFFLYYEETDLQYRYRKKGYKSVIINGPIICHFEGVSSKSNFRKKMNITRSFLLYFKKRMNCVNYFIFRLMLFIRRFPVILKKEPLKEKMEYLKLLISPI